MRRQPKSRVLPPMVSYLPRQPTRCRHLSGKKDLEPFSLLYSRRQRGNSVQLIEHWNFWPQTLQSSQPQPVFLSSLTSTDFSWLQNRHVKVVGSGSRWNREERLARGAHRWTPKIINST